MTYLLDVNVLIALVDPQHAAHDTVQTWFEAEARSGWASCPVTENGLVRIITQPKYINFLGSVADALRVLGALYQLDGHEFWPDSISLLDAVLVEPLKIGTSHQITDTYLLALAVANRGRLATLDRRLSPKAVPGGSEALHLIA